jgi:hypothetical protein
MNHLKKSTYKPGGHAPSNIDEGGQTVFKATKDGLSLDEYKGIKAHDEEPKHHLT